MGEYIKSQAGGTPNNLEGGSKTDKKPETSRFDDILNGRL